METIRLLCCVWMLTLPTVSAFNYTYYDEVIAPAARKLNRNIPGSDAVPLLLYPALRFEPSLDGYDNTVMFHKARPNTHQKYIDKLQALYEAQDKHREAYFWDVMDCRFYDSYRPPQEWSYPCREESFTYAFEPDYSPCSPYYGFGFEDGLPCMFLSLDRVVNWIPEPYRNETVPDEIKDVWSPVYVTVKCEGTDPVSVDNMDVQVSPPGGFHVKYFPDNGREIWKSPTVGVLVIANPAVAVEIKCTIWAANTKHSDLLNTGSIKFTVIVF